MNRNGMEKNRGERRKRKKSIHKKRCGVMLLTKLKDKAVFGSCLQYYYIGLIHMLKS